MKRLIRKILKEREEKNKLPTQKMLDWANYTYNQPNYTMDALELDIFYSNLRQDFLDEFSEELNGLDYHDKLEVFYEIIY